MTKVVSDPPPRIWSLTLSWPLFAMGSDAPAWPTSPKTPTEPTATAAIVFLQLSFMVSVSSWVGFCVSCSSRRERLDEPQTAA